MPEARRCLLSNRVAAAAPAAAARSWRRLLQQRNQCGPYVCQYSGLRDGGRMDAIGLKHRHILAESVEDEWNDGGFMRLRDIGEHRAKAFDVRRAVIRRQLHAGEQYFCACRLRACDHRAEIRAHRREIAAAKRIIAAELDDHDGGPMLFEKRWQPRAAAGGGVARDRRIDDAIIVAFRLEL